MSCVTTRPEALRILRKFDLLHFRQISRYKKRRTECFRSGVEQFCGSGHVAYSVNIVDYRAAPLVGCSGAAKVYAPTMPLVRSR